MPHVVIEDTITKRGTRFRFKPKSVIDRLPKAIDFNICNVPNWMYYSNSDKMYVIPIDTFVSIGLKIKR